MGLGSAGPGTRLLLSFSNLIKIKIILWTPSTMSPSSVYAPDRRAGLLDGHQKQDTRQDTPVPGHALAARWLPLNWMLISTSEVQLHLFSSAASPALIAFLFHFPAIIASSCANSINQRRKEEQHWEKRYQANLPSLLYQRNAGNLFLEIEMEIYNLEIPGNYYASFKSKPWLLF